MNYLTGGIKTATAVATKFGKHKVPRYIYHMTSKTNYSDMLANGTILPHNDRWFGDGIFAVELTNLFKRWNTTKVTASKERTLMKDLVKHISEESDDIVMLKIPTDKLNQENLFARKLEDFIEITKLTNAFDYIVGALKMNNLPISTRENFLRYRYGLKEQIIKFLTPETRRNLTKGTHAKYSSLLKQRKDAIEYIYKGSIPITDIEKIGEINLTALQKSSEYDTAKPMRSIFTKLLEGTPEVKGAELLNC